MANFFITGANGFVGQRFIKYLIENNHTPCALVKDMNRKTDSSIRKNLIQKGAEIRGSILDKDLIRSVLSKYEIDYVINLAAVPIVKACDSDPWTAYNVNVMGPIILFEAVREQLQRCNRIKKVIHMSTDKSYGDSSPPGGYVEDTPFKVTDTYSVSKACGDMIARSYAKTYDLPICVVRCGNLYGGGDLNLSRIIPGTILRLLNRQRPVLYTDAAEMKREFIHVKDIIQVYMTLVENGVPGEAYNVGTSEMYKIIDLINIIKEKLHSDIDIDIVERKFFEINEQCLNSNKLQALGWKAAINLSEGLDEAIEWYTKWWSETTPNNLK